MAMNSLGGIKHALTSGHNEILLDRKLGEAAKLPLQRMLDFAAGLKKKMCSTAWALPDLPSILPFQTTSQTRTTPCKPIATY
ncbi:hypothetical protein NEIELOOT_00458 [Neisseria elongata subsp. glycolytica ATCC 29315]|uniref:Quinolinate synthase n=1 Tax=Neisseria elongata subsp. glycolytica ATCC 29315 TaxID=546263 RepID=D4DN34_NEIEG|nr:hypothetical protein NEIELOOT_00458 [Neisseria elongata subsp. glycolytica ATCC 29315]